MKYLLLDVAGTILHKPNLYDKILEVLQLQGYKVSLHHLKYNHKILSETIKFPDRTDHVFYEKFNSELLYSLGIIPNDGLLEKIFNACSYLPWEKFEDTKVLDEVPIPLGIISNFNSSLKEKLNGYFSCVFSDIFVSEELGVSKPSIQFYEKALEIINLNPEEILYVGDSFKLDFEPANKLGIKTLVIDRENFYPDNPNVIKSLSDIKKFI